MHDRHGVGFKTGRIISYQQHDLVYTIFIFFKSNLFSKIIMAKILLRNHVTHTKFKLMDE